MLYRTNFQSRQIEEALRRYGRKYLVVGGFSFYQRAEVKDLLVVFESAWSARRIPSACCASSIRRRAASARAPSSRLEQYALRTYPEPVDGDAAACWKRRLFPGRAEAALKAFLSMIEELREPSCETRPVHEICATSSIKTGYEEMLKSDVSPEAESRLGNMEELVNAAADAAERGETAPEFLDHAALVADADQLDEQAPVSLLTMHNAKGLGVSDRVRRRARRRHFPA